MRRRVSQALALLSFVAPGCGADPSNATIQLPPDSPDAGATPAEDAGAPDATDDAFSEAGPSSCEEPCEQACKMNTDFVGGCATCLDAVCAEHRDRAEHAPDRSSLLTCVADCPGDNGGCANACCEKYAPACAFEVVWEMCRCGFPESDCRVDCEATCASAGLTEACGVCAAQSACALETFDYLFASGRLVHQDCVETCMSGSLPLAECLDRCRDDHADAAASYDAFLGCACAP